MAIHDYLPSFPPTAATDSLLVTPQHTTDAQPHLMHWFKRYEDPAPPQTFLDKFFAGRDDPKQVASF